MQPDDMTQDQINEFMRRMGRKGGSRTGRKGLAAMTPEERKAIQDAGVEARRKKKIEKDQSGS